MNNFGTIKEEVKISPFGWKLIKMVLTLIGLFMLFKWLVLDSMYSIKFNHARLIQNNITNDIREDRNAGNMRIKFPWESVMPQYAIDKQTMSVNSKIATRDGMRTDAQFDIIYQIKDGKKLYTEQTSFDNIQPMLSRYLNNDVNKLTNYNSYKDIRTNNSSISSKLTYDLQKYINVHYKGLGLDQVTMTDVKVPEKLKKAIDTTMVEQQNYETSKWTVAQEKLKQDNIHEWQQKIDICAKNPNSTYCLPNGIRSLGSGRDVHIFKDDPKFLGD